MSDRRGTVSPTSIGVRDLRAGLAAALRRAQAGERLVVTVDGEPVAELGPIGPPPHRPTLAGLAAAGLIDGPTRQDRPVPPDRPASTGDVGLDRLVAFVRGGSL